jgi:hypothetical protein
MRFGFRYVHRRVEADCQSQLYPSPIRETKQRGLETPLQRLDARGGLSGREEAVVEEMADRIVVGFLSPLTNALDGADRDEVSEPEERRPDLYNLREDDV